MAYDLLWEYIFSITITIHHDLISFSFGFNPNLCSDMNTIYPQNFQKQAYQV